MIPANSVLLDTPWPDGFGDAVGPLLFTRPQRILTARSLREIPRLLDALDAVTDAGQYAAGFLSYEAGYAFERRSFAELDARALTEPLAWFGVYESPQELGEDGVDDLMDGAGPCTLSEPSFALDRTAYRDCIGRIKSCIREGEVYQINFTAPFRFGYAGDAVGLYRTLQQRQRVGYGALVRAGATWVLSRSPELFFSRKGTRIATRPMKGTVERGADAQEDADRERWLTGDAKNRAENLMIVDLLRNDLSVVAEPGSVRVPALFTAERYDTLWQMTSTVEATLRADVGTADVLRALFPCGSVTGAPKIRAMQLIAELETEPRGVYCGAVGFVGPGGQALFNVPIRTVILHNGEGRMGSGSGVVWDSDPDAEYDECLLKARFLTAAPPPDFSLLETMRWGGGYHLLDRHLDRLRAAAAYFRFPLDEARVREELEDHAADLTPNLEYKVRLTVDRRGHAHITSVPLDAEPLPLRQAVILPDPIDTSDPFLRHKTTHRTVYERALDRALDAGFDEAILVNERGEVTEGTRTNVFIRRAGRFVTPPLDAGGLGGVYRAHVLATHPEAEEDVLRPADLLQAESVYLCNAVRGLREVSVSVLQ